MESLNIYNQNSRRVEGFMLIEVVIVIGILILIFSFGMVADINIFKNSTVHQEQVNVVSILERARSYSISNISDSAYGFCVNNNNYIIFKGTRCTMGETISSSTHVRITTSETPIVFERFSGRLFPQLTPVEREAVVSISDEFGNIKYIRINNEGTINW